MSRTFVCRTAPVWLSAPKAQFECYNKLIVIQNVRSFCVSEQKPKQKYAHTRQREESLRHIASEWLFSPNFENGLLLLLLFFFRCSFCVCVCLVLHCIHWSRFIWAESTTRTLNYRHCRRRHHYHPPESNAPHILTFEKLKSVKWLSLHLRRAE